MSKKYLIVFGHGRQVGLGCTLRDKVRDQLAAAGAKFRIHDLLADGFDPILRLKGDQPYALPPLKEEDPLGYQYCQDVLWADVLIVIHPVWWFSMPAILKGWVDRILVEGIAISQKADGPPQGLMKDKKFVLIQTFGTSKIIEKTVFASMARKYWKRAVVLPTGANPFAALSIHGADEMDGSKIDRFCRKIHDELLGS